MVTADTLPDGAVARTWSGRVPDGHADEFRRHLMATGVTEARDLPGYLGATVTTSSEDAVTTFTLTTFWQSLSAMRAFGSSDEAILYPGDEAFGLVPDREVVIRDLVLLDLL